VSVLVVRGDARRLPLPDGRVDLIVTSPPYFGLRDYGYAGQIGSETTPAEWLETLWACTREWVRVLKPEGSLFVNLGDKYGGAAGRDVSRASQFPTSDGRRPIERAATRLEFEHGDTHHKITTGAPKSLLGLPWRYAIGCMDRLGLILRAEIIWAKPNGLPESVTDRVRRAHEQVFHFTRQPRYYAAVDEIREPHLEPDRKRADMFGGRSGTNGVRHAGASTYTGPTNPLGKLPGSVWEIPSAPLQVPARLGVDHFAAFPPALVRPLVLGWSPPGVCTACGWGRRPVVDRGYDVLATRSAQSMAHRNGEPLARTRMYDQTMAGRTTITGYACACPVSQGDGHRWCSICGRVITPHEQQIETPHGASHPSCETRPAVVLDPFGGTGTTALVASAYGRHGITVDLSADYCRLAAWRVHDPGERARARAMPKPPPVPDGQEALFTIAEGYSPIF
jgi:DNA modification methylase